MEKLFYFKLFYQDYRKIIKYIIKYYIKEHIYIYIYIYINFNILKYYTVPLKIE